MSQGLSTTRPELRGDFGMVASTHWLASAAGMSVLERGGAAADAAVAAGLVLQVVEPHLNGPGGEVLILVWDAAERRVRVVAGQGVVPAGATPEHYRAEGLDLVPGTGLLAATVPGAWDAWMLLALRWGTWRLRDLLEPALGWAERGWPVLPSISATVDAVAETFLRDWPDSAATWLDAGAPPRAGGRWRNPALAATWRRLLAEAEAASPSREGQLEAARRVWSQGFVAEAIDAHARRPLPDSSGASHAGVLTGADLAAWSTPVEDPVTLDHGDWTVAKTGPWGQGPVLLQQLAVLQGAGLADAGFLTADHLHLVTEVAKLAFADRDAWYGDPAAVDVPLDDLLSPAYSAARRALVGPRASLELRPGSPGGRAPRLREAPVLPPGAPQEQPVAGAGEPTVARDGTTRGDTCHLDVVDRWGTMISATPSGGWLQSSPTIAELGFALGTRAQMTWLEPGLASSLRPGTRPRTTLSPTIALREGAPALAFGTPGGDQQDQWSLHFFLAHTCFGLDLQAAIDAATFHTTHVPSSFWPREAEPGGLVVESRVGPQVLAELTRRGHRVTAAAPWSLGRLSAVGVEAATGFLRGAANARGAQGYAVGR